MYIKYIHMYLTVHQVQLPERGVRAGALVQQTHITISGHFATLGVDHLASLEVKVQTSQGVDSALAL